jgi:hypothetical protein
MGSSSEDARVQAIARWLVQIGRERTAGWVTHSRIIGEDPFTNMLYKAFLATGMGDAFAGARMGELKFRFSKAKEKSVFEFLKRRDERKLDELMDDIGLKGFDRVKDIVKALLDLEDELNIREGISKEKMNILYKRLKEIPYIGEKLRHFIVYDLIRIYNFPPPDGLGPYDELLKKLKALGIPDPKKVFREDEWPYVDAALWDFPSE